MGKGDIIIDEEREVREGKRVRGEEVHAEDAEGGDAEGAKEKKHRERNKGGHPVWMPPF